MRKLERRRVVELFGGASDRRDDRVAVMAGIGAPQSRGAIEQRAVVGGIVMHVLGAHDQARRALKAAIGRKRQPKGFEIVR